MERNVIRRMITRPVINAQLIRLDGLNFLVLCDVFFNGQSFVQRVMVSLWPLRRGSIAWVRKPAMKSVSRKSPAMIVRIPAMTVGSRKRTEALVLERSGGTRVQPSAVMTPHEKRMKIKSAIPT